MKQHAALPSVQIRLSLVPPDGRLAVGPGGIITGIALYGLLLLDQGSGRLFRLSILTHCLKCPGHGTDLAAGPDDNRWLSIPITPSRLGSAKERRIDNILVVGSTERNRQYLIMSATSAGNGCQIAVLASCGLAARAKPGGFAGTPSLRRDRTLVNTCNETLGLDSSVLSCST
jgi:hypothetical protein